MTPHAVISLMQSAKQVVDTVEQHVKAEGWSISRPHLVLAMALKTGISRPTSIASHLGVTRQAVHQTVSEMIAQGLITTVTDPGDKRAKVIQYTPAGEMLGSDIEKAAGKCKLQC
ncbi:MAG: winged helix-turn-helix transcriptional regulator [Gammaproteobacteria bacterium]|nr:winged helix-turn-helix transcriptional regulator [Gammaproteobacteria bacterium]